MSALLPVLAGAAGAERRVGDHELAGHPPGLGQEGCPLLREQMAVEVAGEDALEGAVGEGEGDGVALDHRRRGQPLAR